ncbi:MAG: hypothetical protein CM15mV102_020 [uncultured marine virus]|nr:MAG: hypothetical protein CM15mV102_020 [uncultured marine virus]
MAYTIDENGKVKKAKGSKVAIIKSVEGMQNHLKKKDLKLMKIMMIETSEPSRQDKRKRMGNFLNDVTGRNLLN